MLLLILLLFLTPLLGSEDYRVRRLASLPLPWLLEQTDGVPAFFAVARWADDPEVAHRLREPVREYAKRRVRVPNYVWLADFDRSVAPEQWDRANVLPHKVDAQWYGYLLVAERGLTLRETQLLVTRAAANRWRVDVTAELRRRNILPPPPGPAIGWPWRKFGCH